MLAAHSHSTEALWMRTRDPPDPSLRRGAENNQDSTPLLPARVRPVARSCLTENGAEEPSSRLSSTDESALRAAVASGSRSLSFHGLCSPSRSTSARCAANTADRLGTEVRSLNTSGSHLRVNNLMPNTIPLVVPSAEAPCHRSLFESMLASPNLPASRRACGPRPSWGL